MCLPDGAEMSDHAKASPHESPHLPLNLPADGATREDALAGQTLSSEESGHKISEASWPRDGNGAPFSGAIAAGSRRQAAAVTGHDASDGLVRGSSRAGHSSSNLERSTGELTYSVSKRGPFSGTESGCERRQSKRDGRQSAAPFCGASASATGSITPTMGNDAIGACENAVDGAIPRPGCIPVEVPALLFFGVTP